MRQKGEDLSIENPAARAKARCRPEEVALLGKMTDEAVAMKVGRPSSAVTQKRLKLGVPRTR